MLANRLAMQYDYYFFVLSVGAYPPTPGPSVYRIHLVLCVNFYTFNSPPEHSPSRSPTYTKAKVQDIPPHPRSIPC